MRLAFTVIGLLVVGYLVLNLAKKQAQVLVPRVAASAASAASAANPPAANLPQQVQQDVQKVLQEGAQRASEATR